ncbi:adenylate cyclase [Isoptericola jiangsuensis]|nr:adenylate cyclase [Isoptericola jiangsuensis]
MTTIPSYDADQLAEVLAMLPDVDSVELKLTVPDADQRRVVDVLGIDALDAQIRQVAFLDTPDQRLSAAGLVVRVRRTQGRAGDLTVKRRPLMPTDVPPKLRGRPGFKVELDASPAGFTCSCSLTVEVPDRKARALLQDASGLPALLDAAQRGVVDDALPAGTTLDDVVVLGPVTLLKAKFTPQGAPRRLTAELWFLPDGSRILELSTKAAPRDAFQAAAETKVLLAGRGIDLGAPQETKTRAVLAAFAPS